MLLKIGLTGGIGSGKSAACEIFSELGVPIIDADIIAHALVKPGMSAFEEIIKTFGKEIISQNGTLDRKKLRHRIFANKTERRKLENILHPAIYREIIHQTESLDSGYCIISIPLLLEMTAPTFIDRILIIDVPKDTQLIRAVTRDNTDKLDIETIIDSQISREDRLAAADDIIDNTGDLDELRKKIYTLHELYSSI